MELITTINCMQKIQQIFFTNYLLSYTLYQRYGDFIKLSKQKKLNSVYLKSSYLISVKLELFESYCQYVFVLMSFSYCQKDITVTKQCSLGEILLNKIPYTPVNGVDFALYGNEKSLYGDKRQTWSVGFPTVETGDNNVV